MTQLTENLFAVEVPSDAFNLCVSENNELGYYANIEYFDKMHYDPLPPGSWQLLCTTKEATPEQAKEITGEEVYPSIALAGLCKSKGLDVNKNYCLLKKM